jgi:Fe-S cluster biogenesis protein NfuA|tara:strand:+ start:208 stop:438 length:231 start_codon:yes stop_codon:yes gene_type:complete
MELNDSNVIEVLTEIQPYIEADGGFLEYVETEEGYVKVRLGGACATCAMSTMTLKQGIERKLMEEIPDVKGVVQVL